MAEKTSIRRFHAPSGNEKKTIFDTLSESRRSETLLFENEFTIMFSDYMNCKRRDSWLSLPRS